MRDLLDSVQTATRLPIVLDRRVDPTAAAISQPIAVDTELQTEAPMRATSLGPTLYQALDGLVQGRNESPAPRGVDRPSISWASAGEVVLVGPQDHVQAAATEMLASRLRLQPHVARFPVREVRWPALTTPSDALKIIADLWQLDISSTDLPHDLWPAVNLGEVHVSTALGVVASQFDLQFDLDPASRSLRQRPLNRAAVLRNSYLGLDLTTAQRQAITAGGGKLLKKNDQWELTGDAAAHFQMELAIFRRGVAGKTSPKAVTRYTLKFSGTVGDAFRSLCQAGNLTLDASALSPEQQQMFIELEVKDQTIADILAAIAEKANVKLSIDGTQVTVAN